IDHVKAPDLDKIIRALGDALSRVVFADDAQVCELVAWKKYAAAGDVPHVDVRVEPSRGPEPQLADLPLFRGGPSDASNRQPENIAPPKIAGAARHGRPRHQGARGHRARLRRHSRSADGAHD